MSKFIEMIETNEYLMALAILIGFVLAALVMDLITVRVLLRMTRKTQTRLDDEVVLAMRRPLFFTVVFIGVWVAIGRLNPPQTTRFIIQALLITLAVLLWTVAAIRITKTLLGNTARKTDGSKFVQARTLPLFEIGIKTILIGGAAYGIMLAWHVDVTAWLASAGILGIAIGFAAKDTLSNFFAGIFILADAPYKIGDFIILDSGERGRVTDIGIRSTRILTRDDIQIILPNAVIGNAKIVNETGGPHEKERVRVKVGVAYGSDIDKVREVLLGVAANSRHLLAEPKPIVRFSEFGDSSLNFQLMGWIDEPVLSGPAIDELNTAIYKRFAKEGIEIPFPQRDVHLLKD
jgi:small-conductance mechanosensitive channel